MNPIKWLYDIAVDRNLKISHRAAIIIITITAILMIDNVLGIAYHLRITNKIQQLSKIQELIDNSKDSMIHSYALYLRDDIINRKSIADYLPFRRSSWSSLNLKKAKTNNPIDILSINDSPIRNFFIFNISTSGLFYFSGLSLFFFCLFGRAPTPESDTISERVAMAIIFLILSFGIGYSFSLLLRLIPMIGFNWWWNYLLNVVIQIIVAFGIIVPIMNRITKLDPKQETIS